MNTASENPLVIFWFRRDLRLHDNAGLFHALNSGLPVLPVFIFDKHILNKLDNKKDKRVHFIHDAVLKLEKELNTFGSGLEVMYDTPEEAFKILTENFKVKSVYTNHDYEQYAQNRDERIQQFLLEKNIKFLHFKDQVIFEKDEVMKDDGTAYTVFTPFSKKWKNTLLQKPVKVYDTAIHFSRFIQIEKKRIPLLGEMGFEEMEAEFPASFTENDLIRKYQDQRNFPAIAGTSRLSVHLRFGTISIRQLLLQSKDISETFLNELIWRDFYQMILWNFSYISQGKSFKPAYDTIEWVNNESDFNKWCEGKTGYPIVDAGMRELNATGFMHNRVRMITASFLCKHLLIDWRWGEAYFAEKLIDFDFAANNGGWQWASGSGCDAAPYFRIFNPYLQTQKFDPQLTYIRKWLPELETFDYPKPIVDHDFARKRCLETYKKALNNQS